MTGRGVRIHLTDPADAAVVTPEVLALVLGGLEQIQAAARAPAPAPPTPAPPTPAPASPPSLVWDRGVLTVPPPPMPPTPQT